MPLVVSVLFYCVMTLLGALIASWLGLSIFAPPCSTFHGVVSLGLAVLLAALVVGGGSFLERFEWYARMGRVVGELARRLVGKGAASDCLLLALSSSIGEEALFRGAVQPGLVNFFMKRLSEGSALPALLGVLVASTIFATIHAPLHKDLRPWTAFAFVMGLALGGLQAYSCSIAAPILAHFLVNFLNLRRLLREPAPVATAGQGC